MTRLNYSLFNPAIPQHNVRLWIASRSLQHYYLCWQRSKTFCCCKTQMSLVGKSDFQMCTGWPQGFIHYKASISHTVVKRNLAASILCFPTPGFPSIAFKPAPDALLDFSLSVVVPEVPVWNQINRSTIYHFSGAQSGQLDLIAPFCFVRYMPKSAVNRWRTLNNQVTSR